MLPLGAAAILDVREPNEYASGHIPDALHVPLGELAGRVDELPNDRPVVCTAAGEAISDHLLRYWERNLAGRTAAEPERSGISAAE